MLWVSRQQEEGEVPEKLNNNRHRGKPLESFGLLYTGRVCLHYGIGELESQADCRQSKQEYVSNAKYQVWDPQAIPHGGSKFFPLTSSASARYAKTSALQSSLWGSDQQGCHTSG